MRLAKFILVAAATFPCSAFAADLPSRRAPPPIYTAPPPIFTWTGFYVGGQIGYAFGREYPTIFANTGLPAGATNAYGMNGVIGGAHVGYNYQINRFVVGLEGDVDGSGYSKTNVYGPTLAFKTQYPIQGSIRGRVGYAWDRALIYATGGAAFGSIKNSYAYGPFYDSKSDTRVGYTVGGGVEYALDQNWSVRGEYRFTSYGTYRDSLTYVPGNVRRSDYEQRVQAGFSYKFGYVPPVATLAKY